jgi:hypothetical protein
MKSSGMSSCSDEGVGNMAGWTDQDPEIRPTKLRAASQSAAVAMVNERTQGYGFLGDVGVTLNDAGPSGNTVIACK